MGYTALYRKFRPITFSEMVGQEHITKTLKNQIISDRVGHAYLFNGGRGTGKTSAAKILARAVNCLNPQDGEPCNECEICKEAISGSLTDIVEMDAASNNSVEDIRAIREEVNFLPTKAKYRVYIIDEVHMLSPGAANALLKTLEEPPEHVKFILATTEPQRLPATILSRCQRFDFKRIPNEDIIKRLKIVCDKCGIDVTDEAFTTIAELSEGAMRDALSILERCIQNGDNKIDGDKVKDLVGIPKLTFVEQIIDAIVEYDAESAIHVIDDVLKDGKDINNFLWEIIKYVKDILVVKVNGKLSLYSEQELEKLKNIASKVTKQRAIKIIYELSELENNMKWSNQKTIMFQAGIIKLCNNEEEVTELAEKKTQVKKEQKDKKEVKQNANQKNSAKQQTKEQPKEQKKPVQKASKPQKKAGVKQEFWPNIINDIKNKGKMGLYTNLIGTVAKEVDDMTIEIEFPNGITPFGKAILSQSENTKMISDLVSIEKGKAMNIKFVDNKSSQTKKVSNFDSIESFANEADLPFNIIG